MTEDHHVIQDDVDNGPRKSVPGHYLRLLTDLQHTADGSTYARQNEDGRKEAVKRVAELTEIPRYKKQAAEPFEEKK